MGPKSNPSREHEVQQVQADERPAWLAGQIDQVEKSIVVGLHQLGDRIDAANQSRDETLRRILWSAVGLLVAVVTLLADALVGGLVP